MNILFICNQNINRSKTAEHLFREDYKTKSAGLYNQVPVSKDQIEWADLVFVMEDAQRKELSHRFPKLYMQKRILNLDITDIYYYNQPELIEILKERFSQKPPL